MEFNGHIAIRFYGNGKRKLSEYEVLDSALESTFDFLIPRKAKKMQIVCTKTEIEEKSDDETDEDETSQEEDVSDSESSEDSETGSDEQEDETETSSTDDSESQSTTDGDALLLQEEISKGLHRQIMKVLKNSF